MMKRTSIMIFVFLAISILSFSSENKMSLSVESGLVLPGYNTIQSPNNSTATRFSLSDSLEISSSEYIRLRLSYDFSDRHHISLLYAPLSLDAFGILPTDIVFEGQLFPALVETTAKYRFDSYRLTYRYDLIKTENIIFGIGATAKIRDAEIAITSNAIDAIKTNTGFVPLLNFNFVWYLDNGFGLVFDADALAAKQGRAEDVSIAFFKDLSNTIQISLGYRMVEGGANVEEVYSFALINYLHIGIKISF